MSGTATQKTTQQSTSIANAASYLYKQAIDWNLNPALENETFTSITEYDALNRATNIHAPNNNEIMPQYDEGGLLKTVKAKLKGVETDFVTGISYNPKGQRERIKYGNGAKTKYEYDDKTFRLTRLLTTRSNGTEKLQDLNYAYDPMGNITEITDDAQQDVFFSGQHVSPSQTFEYDALYRLVKATGREHVSMNAGTEPEAEGYNQAQISPEDGSAMRLYARRWEYDEVGNILKLIHQANSNGWTRNYNYATDSNRLNTTTIGQTTVNYIYNEHGSMTSMPHLQSMEWDFAERLAHIARGTTEAYYNYDGSGQRTRKVVEKGNITETRLYLGGFEIWRKRVNGILDTERETLHIMDYAGQNKKQKSALEMDILENGIGNKPDKEQDAPQAVENMRRIAIVETKTWENCSQIAIPVSVQRYQFSNNIESVTLELDENANIISYEEYYPYGETSYQAGCSVSEVSQKRYRYTGKEKDEESGLYYYGARYYSPMIEIFISVDPIFEKHPDVSSYAYCMNNPVKYIDPDGKEVYLVVHGAGYINYKLQKKEGELGIGLKKNAEAYAKNIKNRKDFNPEKDTVVLVEAKTSKQLINATNTKYEQGKIAEMTIFSHGYPKSVSLGGQTAKEAGGEAKAYEQYLNYDLRELNAKNMQRVDKSNFTDDAKISFFGCNIGGYEIAGASNSFGQFFADYMGENRSVNAFTGPSEYTTVKGENTYNGRMIRTADRESQLTRFTLFKPNQPPKTPK